MQLQTNGLQHTISTVMVFQSDEYKRFKFVTGNRQLNESKIKRIINDIEDGLDMLQYYPIQVIERNSRLEIIDGQHRFYICKKLKRVVYYIILKEDRSMPDIAKVNSNVEKWKAKDFIQCYVEQGNDNYQKIQQFTDKYPITLTTAIKLLTTGNPGTESGLGNKHLFERGLLKVTHWDEAVRIAEMCKLFEAYPIWSERGFVIALYRILDAKKIEISDLLEKVEKNAGMLKKQTGFKEYIFHLESIYNKGKQTRLTIY